MMARLREYAQQDRSSDEPSLPLSGWTMPPDPFEVLGFVRDRALGLMVVWRDDAGTIHEIPAWAVQMLPNTETPPDVNVGSLDPVTLPITADLPLQQADDDLSWVSRSAGVIP